MLPAFWWVDERSNKKEANMEIEFKEAKREKGRKGKGKERKGKERKGKGRKGKERKGQRTRIGKQLLSALLRTCVFHVLGVALELLMSD